MADNNWLSKIGGFCVACAMLGTGVAKCVQDNNKNTRYASEPTVPTVKEESEYETTQRTYDYNGYEEETDYSEFEEQADFSEMEADVPSGHYEYVKKQVPCHVCDGQGFTPSNLTASGQIRCGFCSGKGYEQVLEQEWVE